MDICITVKPILTLVKYPTSTVVKVTASLLCLTLRHVLGKKVRLTCSEQVLTGFQEKYYFNLSQKVDINLELILSRSLCSP